MSERELLFEIGTEEIPASYISPALSALREGLLNGLSGLGLSFGECRVAATPRRLAIGLSGLASRQDDRQEEILGPPKKAAYDSQGKPTPAALGFAAKQGIEVEALQVKETAKGEYLLAVVEQPGRATTELLSELLPQLVLSLPFPKSMHWGEGRVQFARPIRWLLAVYDGIPLDFSIEKLRSGGFSWGHRFMDPQRLEPRGFAEYIERLREAGVLVDIEERKAAVIREIEAAASEVGAKVLADPELVDTVTNLVESPYALAGSFSPRFLALPRDVLITSMREHQKYFALLDENGELLPRFVAVNNTKVKDPQLGMEGHQRVLRARLEDAFFFYNEDRQHQLGTLAERLSGVIFQHRLGNMAEKSERLIGLAGALAREFAPDKEEKVIRAAKLCKADLLTSMVGEFPSLQGSIGRDYAMNQNEDPEVAQAIYSHYLPLRAGGELPAADDRVGLILAVADRLDTLAGCFGIGLKVTGAADPFALRRQSIGLINLLLAHRLPLPLLPWIEKAMGLYGDALSEDPKASAQRLVEFIKTRFVNELVAQGAAAEAVEAVSRVEFVELNRCRDKIDALMRLSREESFRLLAGVFKRVNNIIKDQSDTEINPELLKLEAEQKLAKELERVSSAIKPLIAAGDYQQALVQILEMKPAADQFFEQVMVMAEEPELRRNRLALLAAVAQLFLQIGDFSRMYALKQ